MTSRKKNILFIQLAIFLVASILLYNTYGDRDKKSKEIVKIKNETSLDTNSFNDVEYSGFDLSGNRYILKSRRADFKTETPELVNMNVVVAKFFLKNDTTLTITSDEGLYNNITLDMNFWKNVKADYLTDKTLDFSMFNKKQVNIKLKD